MRIKKQEFSKLLCGIASVGLACVGIWMIWRYYYLVELAVEMGSSSLPDASLPIAGITSIIVPIISYLSYQFSLKNSRNKYKVDENGNPFSSEVTE